MAYIIRSIAIIGVIAFNSPVQGGKTEAPDAVATARETVRTQGINGVRDAVGTAIHGVTAAREAAQIMAGLDPETRERLLGLASAGMKAHSEFGKSVAQR